MKFAETYFKTIREEIKAVAPQIMYLGCRFRKRDMNDAVLRQAAEYCDVVGINWYSETIDDLPFPEGFDKPVVIGEFHFGSSDRGNLNSGLMEAADQHQRAGMYKTYVKSALEHPFIVGTHWFQAVDQPVSARFDGENNQIGFLSVTDCPYYEMVNAAREIGDSMYVTRFGEVVSSVNPVRLNKQEQIIIYPNPAQNELNIKGLDAPVLINIYSANGILIQSCNAQNKIYISNLNQGVYIVRITGFKSRCLVVSK